MSPDLSAGEGEMIGRSSKDTDDVVVIGGGPGGYTAAIRAAQHGLRTTLVEADTLGGVCTNWGCIPTKALLHGADIAHSVAQAPSLGFDVASVGLDFGALIRFSRGIVDRMASGIGALLGRNGVTVVNGWASVPEPGVVEVTAAGDAAERTRYRAHHIVLATGAHPRRLPGLAPDGDRIWSHVDALSAAEVPQSLLVIGSGAIGSEFASLYRDLGSEVTLVEALPRILPTEDEEVSRFVLRQFERRGIGVYPGATVTGVVPGPDGVDVTVTTAPGGTLVRTVERVLVAVGVEANTGGMGLEELGVRLDRGFVATDQWCRTNVAGLYAIGDVAGGPCLAHKATHEAVTCIDRIAGEATAHPLDRDGIPGCTYSRPQVASLGLTQEAAEATGRPLRIGHFDLSANGKAVAMGEPSGFVKTIFDAQTGRLLGAHMVGPEVTEMIQGFGIAHELHATADDLAATVFAHPTVSEAMHESVLHALGRPLNRLPDRRRSGA